jgi:hypothetical protein
MARHGRQRPAQPPAFAQQIERRGKLQRRDPGNRRKHVLRHLARRLRNEFVSGHEKLHRFDELCLVRNLTWFVPLSFSFLL